MFLLHPASPQSFMPGNVIASGEAEWAELGAQGFLSRVLGTSSSWVPLGHVGALGLRPHNNSLQRTRVPSSRFFKLCGSPLNSISLGGLEITLGSRPDKSDASIPTITIPRYGRAGRRSSLGRPRRNLGSSAPAPSAQGPCITGPVRPRILALLVARLVRPEPV